MNKNGHCLAPFKSITVMPNGALVPCCSFAGSYGKIEKQESLQDYFNSNTQLNTQRELEKKKIWLIPSCNTCVSHPDKQDRFNSRNIFIGQQSTENKVLHLDISLSNTCNLNCTMCSSLYSTSWYKLDKELGRPVTEPYGLSIESIDKILDVITSDIRQIEIKGGEPLNDKRFEYFLQKLSEKHTPDLELTLITNFTKINDNFVNLLNLLPNLELNISIDGIGDVYQWIRGFEFDELVRLLTEYLPKLKTNRIHILFTSSVYNINTIEAFYDWTQTLAVQVRKNIIPSFYCIATEFRQTPKLLDNTNSLAQIESVIKKTTYNMTKNSLLKLKEVLLTGLNQQQAIDAANEFTAWHNNLIKIRGYDLYGK